MFKVKFKVRNSQPVDMKGLSKKIIKLQEDDITDKIEETKQALEGVYRSYYTSNVIPVIPQSEKTVKARGATPGLVRTGRTVNSIRKEGNKLVIGGAAGFIEHNIIVQGKSAKGKRKVVYYLLKTIYGEK